MIDFLANTSQVLNIWDKIVESHPARLVDLLLMVQDGVFPWEVEELQDNGQPSEQECKDMDADLKRKPSGMEDNFKFKI